MAGGDQGRRMSSARLAFPLRPLLSIPRFNLAGRGKAIGNSVFLAFAGRQASQRLAGLGSFRRPPSDPLDGATLRWWSGARRKRIRPNQSAFRQQSARLQRKSSGNWPENRQNTLAKDNPTCPIEWPKRGVRLADQSGAGGASQRAPDHCQRGPPPIHYAPPPLHSRARFQARCGRTGRRSTMMVVGCPYPSKSHRPRPMLE